MWNRHLIWDARRWERASRAVPDVVDETEAAAGTAIVAAGLVVGVTTSANDAVIILGNVISQVPAAAQVVGPDARVDLVISLGP